MDYLSLRLEIQSNHLGVVIHASTALNRILAHLLCCVRLGLHVEESVETLAVEFRQAQEEYCVAHPDNVLPFDHTLGRISVSRAFYDGIVNTGILECIKTLVLVIVLVFARDLIVFGALKLRWRRLQVIVGNFQVLAQSVLARELRSAWKVLRD